ncbi:hypothetical protein JHW43_005069 [Diplocarpon mali]|nr:hypothetical protein JHW43_005069 [Diplocarpon mali]
MSYLVFLTVEPGESNIYVRRMYDDDGGGGDDDEMRLVTPTVPQHSAHSHLSAPSRQRSDVNTGIGRDLEPWGFPDRTGQSPAWSQVASLEATLKLSTRQHISTRCWLIQDLFGGLPEAVPHIEYRSQSDSQSVDDCEKLLCPNPDTSLPSRSRGIHTWAALIATLLASITCFGLGTWVGSRTNDGSCLEHVQRYSPILSEVDRSYHTVRFNGSFMKENVFRQGAGPEVDAAWESLGINYRGIAVPVSEGAKSGLKHDHVQISPKHGGGFPANVEGLHHLHCLNLVRQSLYYNIDYYRSQGKGAFVNDDNIVRYHVSHCLDIVRQQLMCTLDTGLLGQIWWDREYPKAFVDFNTEHTCKNFDAIRKWAEERQIPEKVPEDFLKPPQVGDTIYEAIP